MFNIDAQQKAIVAAGAALVAIAGSAIAAGVYLSDATNRDHLSTEAGKAADAVKEAATNLAANLNPFAKAAAPAAAPTPPTKAQAVRVEPTVIKPEPQPKNRALTHYKLGDYTLSALEVSPGVIELDMWIEGTGILPLAREVFGRGPGEVRIGADLLDAHVLSFTNWYNKSRYSDLFVAAARELAGHHRIETRDHARAATILWEPAGGGVIVATGFNYPSKPEKCWVEFSADRTRRLEGAEAVMLLAVGQQVAA